MRMPQQWPQPTTTQQCCYYDEANPGLGFWGPFSDAAAAGAAARAHVDPPAGFTPCCVRWVQRDRVAEQLGVEMPDN